MVTSRVVEYVFFFGLLGVVGYLVWQIIAPFVSALALSAIIVTICFPLYERVRARVPHHNTTLAALLTTFIVLGIVIAPFIIITSLLLSEAVTLYQMANNGSSLIVVEAVENVEGIVQDYAPGFTLNLQNMIQQTALWFTGSLGAIFAGTASTIFLFFISMIGSFYFFRDGRVFTHWLVRISPLPDGEDEQILSKLALAVRSVATGVLLVALVQGTLTAIGFTLFGFDRAVLIGAIATIGALIPSVGTSVVFVPAFIYAAVTGQWFVAVGIGLWGMFAVGLIDNFLGPYLMSRGIKQHAFVTLISVLGGIALFGPIGFIVGPVIMSLFLVLLELYNDHIVETDEEHA